MLIISMIVLWRLNKSILNDPALISGQDFSQFWAAGKLNFRSENPYDPDKINEIKNDLSGLDEQPLYVAIAYNPPWVLSLFLPFALIDYPTSRLIWLILNIVILIYCANKIWHMYGGSQKHRWVPILAAFVLGPVILVLRQGQLTPIVLLGIVGFLDQIENHNNEWLAGFFAAFVSVKPQVFYLFWIALLLWVIAYRRWKVLVGFILTISLTTVFAALFNPKVIQQFVDISLNYAPIA